MLISTFILSRVAPVMLVCGAGVVSAQVLPSKPAKPKVENAYEVIENAAKNAQADAKSVQSDSLRVLQARARQLNARMVEYQKDVASGKVTPFPEVTKNWDKIKNSLVFLQQNLAKLEKISPDDKVEHAKASAALLTALQPLGRFLQVGDYKKVDTQLTEKQLAELSSLDEKWISAPDTADKKNGFIEPLGSDRIYTLTHLPVPLSVKTTPGAKVMFRAGAGGRFENGLAIIEVTADKETGLASTTWVTHGFAVADCPINYRSSTVAAPEGGTKIVVKKLLLAPPPNVEVPLPAKNTIKP